MTLCHTNPQRVRRDASSCTLGSRVTSAGRTLCIKQFACCNGLTLPSVYQAHIAHAGTLWQGGVALSTNDSSPSSLHPASLSNAHFALLGQPHNPRPYACHPVNAGQSVTTRVLSPRTSACRSRGAACMQVSSAFKAACSCRDCHLHARPCYGSAANVARSVLDR
jgi:hypothetical protein